MTSCAIRDAYTAKKLAPLLGMAFQNVLYRAKSRNWQSRPRAGRGGGVEWLVSSMDEESRKAIALALANAKVAEAAAAAAVEAAQVVDTRGGLSAPVDVEAMPKGAKAQRAHSRVMVVRLAEEYAQTARMPRTPAFETFASLYNLGRVDVPGWVRDALPRLSRQSLENWRKAVNTEGLGALAGKHGKHRAGKGAVQAQPELLQFALGHIYEFPHATAVHIYKGMKARFRKSETVYLPTLRAVQAWYKRWREENEGLFDSLVSPDLWRSKHMLALGSASALVTDLNDLWEEDSTKADLILADGTRHIIVGIIDVYSRRVTFHVSRSSSAHAVASCNRKAMIQWGVPAEAKTDNGSDYVSHYIVGMFNTLGVLHTVCPPFSPEKKPHIERVFKTLLHDIFPTLSGYVGHSVAERKQIEAQKSFAQRMMQDKAARFAFDITPEQLQAICDEWANNTYMHAPHAGLGGKTPYDVVQAYDGPVRRIDNERALDMLLLPCPGNGGLRTVDKKGIGLFGARYIAPESGLYAKRKVLVRIDDTDIGRIYLFDPQTDAYLFTAHSAELAGLSMDEARNISVAAKRTQREKLTADRKLMRAAAGAVNVKDIARERRAADAERAAEIVAAAPARQVDIVQHTTDALKEAARASRAHLVPQPMPVTAGEEAARKQVERAMSLTYEQVVTGTPEVPEERYKRARDYERLTAKGFSFPPEEMEWLRRYKLTVEYNTRRDLEELFAASAPVAAAAEQ